MKKKKIKIDKNGFPLTKEQEEKLSIKAEEEERQFEEDSDKVNQGMARNKQETKEKRKIGNKS